MNVRIFLSLIVAMLFTQTASASMILFMNDLATEGIDVVIIDNQLSETTSDSSSPWTSTNNDGLAGDGVIGFAGSVGSFFVNLTTAGSNPFLSDNTIGLASFNVTGGSGGEMEVWVVDTDFTNTGGLFDIELSGFTSGSVSLFTYADSGNGEGADNEGVYSPPGSLLASASNLNGVFAFDDFSTNEVAGSSSYSVAFGVHIEHDGLGLTKFVGQLSQRDGPGGIPAVPEPGTLAVWSVLALGMVVPRRKKWNLRRNSQ